MNTVKNIKRLAVFLDGTWNTVGNNTNVWRLKSLCAPRSADGIDQYVYYSEGVGTRFGEKWRGGLFGYGFQHEIADAYEWLVEQYVNGDEIFIFGFSRGAFLARSLAGFIANCGLLKPGSPLGVEQIYARYRRGKAEHTIRKLIQDRASGAPSATIEDRLMLEYAQTPEIKMVGVWDTVGSLGLPGFWNTSLARKNFGFLNTELRLPILNGFHALAIDEHRKSFQPTLWTKQKYSDPKVPTAPDRSIDHVEQRWFSGAHANVGGGYPSDLLAQIPLKWTMDKASALGLEFKPGFKFDGDASTSPVIDSFTGFGFGVGWLSQLGQPYYRPIPLADVHHSASKEESVNETIDGSVFDRWRSDKSYRPANLEAWAAKYNVKPADFVTSVMVKNPALVVN